MIRMHYEEVLHRIGDFGKYQKWVIFLSLLSTVPNGLITLSAVFILDSPEHHCRIPSLENQTIVVNETENELLLSKYIPEELDEDGNWRRSQCRQFITLQDIKETVNNSTTECRDGWTYYPIYGEYTAVMEFDVVCSMAWLKPTIISLYTFGLMIGSAASGIISDRYGRRPVFLWGTLIQFVCMFATGLSYNVWMCAILHFVCGFTGLMNYVAIFVITSELVNSSKRALVGSLEITGFAIGYLMLPAAAYLLPNWRWLMWFLGAGGVLFIPYYWWVPESPRWLIINGKHDDAISLIRKIAKTNGRKLTEEDLAEIYSNFKAIDNENAKDFSRKFSYIDLFRPPTIRSRTLIMFFVWCTISLTYYCISLSTSVLDGNKFINCFVSAAVEIPSYTSVYFLIEHFGRRSILATYLLLGGIACFFAPFFSSVSVTAMIVLAMICKFAIAGVFSLVFIYCCELYPTKMRNMGVGAASTVARIGGVAAPYLVFVGEAISVYIPYIVMGSLTILSGVASLFLPETHNTPLPENLTEAIDLDRFKLNPCNCRKSQEFPKGSDQKPEDSTMQ